MPRHKYNLRGAKPVFASEDGAFTKVTKKDFPILKNLSMERMVLAPGATREPHWHVNANELTYLLQGKVHVSVLDSGTKMATFTMDAGEMFHIEAGSLHVFENVGDEDAELIICFRHEEPEDFFLGASSGAFTDAVMANTYDADEQVFKDIPRTTQPRHIFKRDPSSKPGKATIPYTARFPDSHRFDIEGQQPPTAAPGVGSARKARSQFWPALKNMAMYSLTVEDSGMREPHWHPDTVEMGYVHTGRARMSVMDPDGSVDTYYLEPGECYFLPAAYPHQIESLESDIHFLIFFDNPMPKDVGFRSAGVAIPRALMAATFGTSEKGLPGFPFEAEDPLLVAKKNSIDPVKSRL
jgi:oxalate decarboxylase